MTPLGFQGLSSKMGSRLGWDWAALRVVLGQKPQESLEVALPPHSSGALHGKGAGWPGDMLLGWNLGASTVKGSGKHTPTPHSCP
jgi:hypothetical protein